METDQFLAFVDDPASVNTESLKQFEELLTSYPYFQTAIMLYAYNLYQEDHPQYPYQIKKAAAYASDRKKLKRLIDQYKLKKATPVSGQKPVKEEPEKKIPVRRVAFKPVSAGPGTGSTDSRRDKLLEIVHRRLAEITEEHDGQLPAETAGDVAGPAETPQSRKRITFTVKDSSQLTRDELIEKFILEEPKISSPRISSLKPDVPAEPQAKDDEELVSETLAILYHKQGNVGKSIRVYEKLCLLFPEKSSYFAARIEELKANEQ